jgi:uncharacterized membrane protein
VLSERASLGTPRNIEVEFPMNQLPGLNLWEVHPMLVHFPIALLLVAVAADIWNRFRPRDSVGRAAGGLYVLGVIAGWLTALAGLLAFFTVPAHTEQAHVWMYWHLGFAAAAMVLFTGLAILRWRARVRPPMFAACGVSLLAAALLAVTGYLGGAIVYHGGAGIQPDLLAEAVREGHHHGGEHDHHDTAKPPANHAPQAHDEGHAEAHRHGSAIRK